MSRPATRAPCRRPTRPSSPIRTQSVNVPPISTPHASPGTEAPPSFVVYSAVLRTLAKPPKAVLTARAVDLYFPQCSRSAGTATGTSVSSEADLALQLGPGMVEASRRVVRDLRLGHRRVRPRAVRHPPRTCAPAHRPGAAGHPRPRVLRARRRGRPRGRRTWRSATEWPPTHAGGASAVWPAPAASTTSARCRGSIGAGLRRRVCAAGALPRLLRRCRCPTTVSDARGRCSSRWPSGCTRCDRGGARPGETVVVLGFGPIGACTAEIAAAMGLTVLVSASRAPSGGRGPRRWATPRSRRRARAREVAKAVRGRTGGGAQLVVDASGVPAALEAAPEMTRRGGRMALVGLPEDPPSIDAARLVLYERSLHRQPRLRARPAASRGDDRRGARSTPSV